MRQAFLPPALLLTEPSSPDAFERRVESLFTELDEARVEALSDAEEQEMFARPDAGTERPVDGDDSGEVD
jgi:hypothetical protein